MLRFFRQFRKSITENSHNSPLGKYTLYAIGEILLVMVGILLALQVNNWNEQRKQRLQEVNILLQLKADLINNKNELQSIYDHQVFGSRVKDSILFFLENPTLYEEKIKAYLHNIQFSGGVFNNANTTYKVISSGGVNVISNQKLLGDITMMYENFFFNINVRWDFEFQMINNHLMPLFFEHLKPTQRAKSMSTLKALKNSEVLNFPKDPTTLKNDSMFINVLTKYQESKRLRKFALEMTFKKIDELIESIENEIKRIK